MPDYPTEFILIGSYCWVTRSAACLHAQAARAKKIRQPYSARCPGQHNAQLPADPTVTVQNFRIMNK
jgi:hypothetical protein